ncbi:SusD/RagB family nutrient-binding outer membrane lipoprotein [Chitinophaga ginsengisoli]|uniref:SusD-like starch-binding protein associating with outer membrane n=1 Tax=Chitinophaga ginsengisoli TaxID=363837 RepID=A0A2P8G7L9_9BACT|nr:SusD/RagB family nutrient-binding outer membrane lipoprotein [Chitinophaga ginsengisoli]PSL29865.1 SusD-like starch-binding protein associating with outer membrane [Chitinophaga ginsengisoli]
MKSLHKLLLVLCLPALLVMPACTKNFEDLNTDKNKSGENSGVPEYNFTRAILEFTGNSDYSYDTWRVNIIYCSMMMQQLANVSWYAGDKYIQNDGWAAAYFERAYPDQIKYITDVIRVTKDNAFLSNQYNIARIAKVMIFHRLTDIYGDIPYSEAGKGYSDRNFAPKYDAQQEIYMDMLKELDEAAKALDATKAIPGQGDLIYNKGGAIPAAQVVANWKKLAYSLMLRLGMRLSKRDDAVAKTWVEKAYTGGLISSNEENAFILHDASGGRTTVNRVSNILSGEWHAIDNVGEACISKTFMDFLKNNNDPRLQYIAVVPASNSEVPADQLGMPNGYDSNEGATDIKKAPGYPGDTKKYSVLNRNVLLKLNGPTFLVTYAQVELLLAEAAKRGWSVGADAATHYNNGVKAAMEQLAQYSANASISGAEVQAYLTAHPYKDTDGYNQINTQYWAACVLDWYEAWANWRRSGYPQLTPVNYVGNATGGKIPRRMLYPSSELASNPTNYQEAIKRQGTNALTTPVWWDKQ